MWPFVPWWSTSPLLGLVLIGEPLPAVSFSGTVNREASLQSCWGTGASLLPIRRSKFKCTLHSVQAGKLCGVHSGHEEDSRQNCWIRKERTTLWMVFYKESRYLPFWGSLYTHVIPIQQWIWVDIFMRKSLAEWIILHFHTLKYNGTQLHNSCCRNPGSTVHLWMTYLHFAIRESNANRRGREERSSKSHWHLYTWSKDARRRGW